MMFDQKTVLVTGASRGIGRAIALAMARQGARVAVNYLNSAEGAQDVAGQIQAMGRQAMAVQADVRRLEDVRRMAAIAQEQLGPVDILVNNAGITRDNFINFMNDEEWNDVMDTHLKGAFYGIKVIGREMSRRRCGKIINISSAAGLMGDMMRANYASAKAGLLGLTRTAARELAGSGITVNAIAPGVIETDLVAATTEIKRQKQRAMIPMERFGSADEVANVAVFLASPAADYMTGTVLCVDGGLYMHD